MTYVQIRPGLSWHVVLTHTRGFDTYRTKCGRTIVTTNTLRDLPGEMSCESCGRALMREQERG